MSASSQNRRDTHRVPRRDERLYMRLTPDLKTRVERAAELSDQTVSQFLRKVTEEATRTVIEQHEMLILSARDSQALMEALSHPQPPHQRLVHAAERYRALMGEK